MSADDFLAAAYRFASASWPGCRPAEVRIVMQDGTVKSLALPDFATLAFLAQQARPPEDRPASGSSARRS